MINKKQEISVWRTEKRIENSLLEILEKSEQVNYSGGVFMADLSELELQNLRHLIGGYDVTHCKMKEYAQSASDAKVKQFFEKGAKSAMENKTQLMKFLQ